LNIKDDNSGKVGMSSGTTEFVALSQALQWQQQQLQHICHYWHGIIPALWEIMCKFGGSACHDIIMGIKMYSLNERYCITHQSPNQT